MSTLVLQTGRRGLRELAYLSIRDAIIELRLAPGARVTEESLSAELGVSRPVLREALQRLQFDQLIDRLDNGRLRVRPITVVDVEHLYAVRSVLEQLVVREATPRCTDRHLTELTGVVEQMRNAERTPGAAITTEGAKFHRLLAQIAGNPVNDHLMHQIQTQLDRIRHISVTVAERPHESVDEHVAILDAMGTGDVEGAAGAMAVHVQSGRDAAISAIRRYVDLDET